MKVLIITALTALALSVTATAGNPNLCNKNGWQTAQAANGSAFSSQKECQKARDVFQPRLEASASAVQAGEELRLTGSGFHSGAPVTLSMAALGEPPASVEAGSTDAAGTYIHSLTYSGCASTSTVVEMTLYDGLGLHASVRVTVC